MLVIGTMDSQNKKKNVILNLETYLFKGFDDVIAVLVVHEDGEV